MKTTSVGLFAILLSLPLLAWADRARPPRDYVVDVGGSGYVFVMLAKRDNPLFDPGAPDDVGVVDRDANIRRTYKLSGMYLKGSKTPLWSVSWYAFEVYPNQDGEHLVRMGPWASSMDQLAVSFYTRGVETKRYTIGDLVKNRENLRHTVSHFFWLSEQRYDEKANTLHLKTVDGLSYVFSAINGEIVQ
ncbi:MAG: hypothetical protein KKF85_12965 [Gammaproteobacteria bacterium]|nr:hypothetical protein [Rhodocyclaceae bacterium]MBU3909944.1 hypothetical protein [Gammaproteobacteria bacterium]MBU3988045.1 hypothetical protein [Gammaproteobacteria bacterium]MBU4003477.1 hypothetical protein [Gammaproteobacteria bacterium]MBU4020164.1 hypothetical protein [Gammaproteobacteria bacterium]